LVIKTTADKTRYVLSNHPIKSFSFYLSHAKYPHHPIYSSAFCHKRCHVEPSYHRLLIPVNLLYFANRLFFFFFALTKRRSLCYSFGYLHFNVRSFDVAGHGLPSFRRPRFRRSISPSHSPSTLSYHIFITVTCLRISCVLILIAPPLQTRNLLIEISRVTDLYFRVIPSVLSPRGCVSTRVQTPLPGTGEYSKLLRPSQSAPCTLDYSPACLLIDKITRVCLFTCNHPQVRTYSHPSVSSATSTSSSSVAKSIVSIIFINQVIVMDKKENPRGIRSHACGVRGVPTAADIPRPTRLTALPTWRGRTPRHTIQSGCVKGSCWKSVCLIWGLCSLCRAKRD
jgi:hypothetical protein